VLVSTQKRFVAALEKLGVYVQLALSAESHSRTQESNAPTILKHANNSMAAVHQAFQAYASHLISKISQEHRAPYVLPELKAVNEKVLNSLSALTATTAKMVELMNDYMSSHSSAGAPATVRGVECDPLKMSEDLPRMQSQARHYFGLLLERNKPDIEPSEVAASPVSSPVESIEEVLPINQEPSSPDEFNDLES